MERKRVFSWVAKYWLVLIICGGCVFAGFLIGLLIFDKPWHLQPAIGDLAAWIEAVATIGLLIGAIVTARYAIKAFGKQTEQLRDQRKVNAEQIEVLKLQNRELQDSLAERRRAAEQLKRAQASKVDIQTRIGPDPGFGVIPGAASIPAPQTVTVRVTNNSDQPIYNADLIWDDGSMGYEEFAVWPGATRLAQRIGPGESATRTKQPNDTPDADGAVLRFRDAAGVAWLRTPGGYLMDFTGGPSSGWSPDLSDPNRLPP